MLWLVGSGITRKSDYDLVVKQHYVMSCHELSFLNLTESLEISCKILNVQLVTKPHGVMTMFGEW